MIAQQLRIATNKYGAITLTNLQNQLVYIWEALNRAFFIVIIMVVFVQLWSVAYGERSAIAGLTLADMIWYLLVAETMELSKSRHDMRISAEVKDGTIAYTLLRPYNYLGYHFANGLGEQLVKMALVFLLGLPIVVFYANAGRPNLQLQHLPLVLLVAGFAIMIDFMVFSIIGLLAFVTEDTSSFRLIYQKLVFILGGLMLPIDFLPGWLQGIARVLPFNLTTYAPAKLFVAFEWAQFWQILGLQLFWIAIIGAILYKQYQWAVQRLAVNGG